VRADTSFFSFTVKNSTPTWKAVKGSGTVATVNGITTKVWVGDGNKIVSDADEKETTRKIALGLGSGSALNFIRRITLTSRSGDELERVERVNQLAPILDNYTRDPAWFRTIGKMMGYSPVRGRQDRYSVGPKPVNEGYGQTLVNDATRNRFFVDAVPQDIHPDGTNLALGAGDWSADGNVMKGDATGIVSSYRAAREVHGMHPGFIIPALTDSMTPGEVTFIIPLSCMFGLFRTCDKLLPSMLTSGLRFEIEFEDANVVARGVEAGIPDYHNLQGEQHQGPQNGEVYSRYQSNKNVMGNQIGVEAGVAARLVTTLSDAYDWPPVSTQLPNLVWTIEDPVITLDQYQLTDSMQRVLNEEAAMRGLEVVFTTYHNTQSSVNGNTIRQEMRKAVSRALTTITKVRGQLSGSNSEILRDSFLSIGFDRLSWQVRLGSLYFPQQPVTGKAATRTVWDTHSTLSAVKPLIKNSNTAMHTSYWHTLRAFNKVATPTAPCCVTPEDFQGYPAEDLWYIAQEGAANTCEYGGYNVLAVDLERSNVQKLTGVPINNARVLEVRITLNPDNTNRPTSLIADTWLHHVRLLRVFLQNIEVEE
jgi:hypothetical protein